MAASKNFEGSPLMISRPNRSLKSSRMPEKAFKASEEYDKCRFVYSLTNRPYPEKASDQRGGPSWGSGINKRRSGRVLNKPSSQRIWPLCTLRSSYEQWNCTPELVKSKQRFDSSLSCNVQGAKFVMRVGYSLMKRWSSLLSVWVYILSRRIMMAVECFCSLLVDQM